MLLVSLGREGEVGRVRESRSRDRRGRERAHWFGKKKGEGDLLYNTYAGSVK